jgi:large subunit ribosomal protein L7Ae
MPKSANKGKKTQSTGPQGGGVQKKTNTKITVKNATLFEKTPKNFGIGQDVAPKRNMTHFVRWPKYVRLQRQHRILLNRLKVPPVINQFTNTLDKNAATSLFKILHAHRPEDKATKKKRLLDAAQKTEPQADAKKPKFVKMGINHVTSLVESKKAKLVVIAHDVDPIEIVMWLPTLCVKMGIPYVIVKGKARLGQVVHKKTAAVLAVTEVDPKFSTDFTNLVALAKEQYNSKYTEQMKKYGGRTFGYKHTSQKAKQDRRRRKEEAKKEQ